MSVFDIDDDIYLDMISEEIIKRYEKEGCSIPKQDVIDAINKANDAISNWYIHGDGDETPSGLLNASCSQGEEQSIRADERENAKVRVLKYLHHMISRNKELGFKYADVDIGGITKAIEGEGEEEMG